jgi:hypothetical protein
MLLALGHVGRESSLSHGREGRAPEASSRGTREIVGLPGRRPRTLADEFGRAAGPAAYASTSIFARCGTPSQLVNGSVCGQCVRLLGRIRCFNVRLPQRYTIISGGSTDGSTVAQWNPTIHHLPFSRTTTNCVSPRRTPPDVPISVAGSTV